MGPSSLGVPSRSVTVLKIESRISGIEEPRASRVKLAIVGFQKSLSTGIVLAGF
jgi:hypothetical protein